MTQWILPPKHLNWTKTLEQKYSSTRTVGVVSGSSFTAGTNQLTVAASWPGYVYERCGLEKVIDLSFPGTSNQYISDSTINYLESISQQEKNNLFVIVMWNGIGPIEHVHVADIDNKRWPEINGNYYAPVYISKKDISTAADHYYNLICKTGEYLSRQQIPYAFTFYANQLFPPLLPTPDGQEQFYKYTTNNRIKKLQSYNLFPITGESYLYDYTFFNDQFGFNGYHPTVQAYLGWTDAVLLPALVKLNIVNSII
jgi:hypothetical protein